MRTRHVFLLVLFLSFCPAVLAAVDEPGDRLTASTFAGLAWRALGPGIASGRIADIAVHPMDSSTWYVAAGSGGVWKTENAGTTWTPVFDDQGSYSIGSLAIDPMNPEQIWVGTGENVSGRHVGFGDGLYKSRDGGASWTNVGLGKSEHISRILVDPRDPEVVYVAAEGPLWAAGGERGVYKTVDGGASWQQVLSVSENTGATDLEFDPRNPDVLFAAAYQRRRHVWSLLAGGPESGIHKSTDGGATWRELTRGLPEGDMGKIGLAVSPVDPDVVYATIEASEDERGFYRSTDAGESWEKRSSYVSNGTGPHYYQEIVASPHHRDRVYQMDVWLHATEDGGKTFAELGEPDKHSDNHALWIDPKDEEHLIAGSDGGLYETLDHGATWRFAANLPLTQLYKLALDDDQPIYHVVGGTQDNGTLYGPAATLDVHGVANSDWRFAFGADGYACAVDPENPDVVYVTIQVGTLARWDRRTGEQLDIQPQPAPGEAPERWNWDSPLLVSPHAPARLYFASQRLWRSDDRGDSWRAMSNDLTRGRNRYELELAGRVWSVDDLYDNSAMSWYGTISAISESPLAEGLLYAGTDDGLIQVSEDGGATWRQSGPLPGVPDLAFVNDLEASPHDPDTIYAVLDDHKRGDFTPRLVKSADRGRTWTSIRGDLPDRHLPWAIVEDHARPGLLYLGTEFGVFFTLDGKRWIELEGGMPTIAIRDLELQRRAGDLVAASFGRGFFVLDDVSPLREASADLLERGAILFPPRPALWYVPAIDLNVRDRGYQGSDYFLAPNPPFGAVFTYYLKEETKSTKERRREREKELREKGEDTPFPGWEALRAERVETAPQLLLAIADLDGNVVRRLEAPGETGFHRVAWDLRLPPPDPISLEEPGPLPPWAGPPQGPLAAPGRYRVRLERVVEGAATLLGEPQEVELVPLENWTLPPADFAQTQAFTRRTAELLRLGQGAAAELDRAEEKLDYFERAALAAPGASAELRQRIRGLARDLYAVRERLSGDPVRGALSEPTAPSVMGRLYQISYGSWGTRSGPTTTHRRNLEIAESEYATVSADLRRLLDTEIPAIEQALEAAGAPWTPGRELPPPDRR